MNIQMNLRGTFAMQHGAFYMNMQMSLRGQLYEYIQEINSFLLYEYVHEHVHEYERKIRNNNKAYMNIYMNMRGQFATQK